MYLSYKDTTRGFLYQWISYRGGTARITFLLRGFDVINKHNASDRLAIVDTVRRARRWRLSLHGYRNSLIDGWYPDDASHLTTSVNARLKDREYKEF